MDALPERTLKVAFPSECAAKVHDRHRIPALVEVLGLDPRPSYHDDPERVYGLSFAGQNVKFRVSDGVLTVLDIE